MSRMSACLRGAEVLGTGERLNLSVAQLPFVAGERWVGLPPDPGKSLAAGKLSLVLRSLSIDSVGRATRPGLAEMASVKPTWAGDVSPALGNAPLPRQVVAAERPTIEVIHGTKSSAVKPQ